MQGRAWIVFVGLAMGCGPVVGIDDSGGSTTASTSTSTTVPPTTSRSDTASTLTRGETDGAATTAESTSGSVETTTGAGSDSDASTGWDCTMLPSCGGKIWQCADGEDNDDDGYTDLEDPECTNICDNDEFSFGNSIPGDGWLDCRLDCFFDGNSGMGDDLCQWDLRCDPLEPGAPFGCDYVGTPNPNDRTCPDQPMTPPQCVDFCEPLVPNGCDCFGCCSFQTAEGPKNFFLEHPSCGLEDDFAGCQECTQQMEICGNPCEVEACEICVGELEPAPECTEVGCVGGTPCTEQCDCPMGDACVSGCCLPAPPG